MLEIVIDSLWSKTVYIHCLARYIMFYTPLNLRRTASIVRTVIGSLTFIADEFSTAFRTTCDKLHLLSISRTLRQFNAYNLRYYLTAFLHIDIITYMEVELTYSIFVIQ